MEKETTKLSRNQIHEKLMICTYQYIFFLSMEEKQDIQTIINSSFGYSESKNDPFVKDYFITLIKNYDEIVSKITPLLKETWRFERLAYLERAILILGTIEKAYLNMPTPIVTNICVKLAHIYCDDDSYKFINAIIQKV